ncbi:MAG: restriction endonuclease [Methylacidiphilales bacterium]|nr:restriction endonuclease [Candidatus Methylacidiphilales bacterium]
MGCSARRYGIHMTPESRELGGAAACRCPAIRFKTQSVGAMSRTTSDLPFGSEFSPNQIDLPSLLEIVAANEGIISAIEAAIRLRYFAGHSSKNPTNADSNQKKLAMNCRLGLQAYGIIDADGSLTTLGADLCSLATSEADLYRVFGRHILLNLNGMRVVQCVLDMMASGETVTLEALENGLSQRGLAVAKISRQLSTMRLWLEKAGVFGKAWQQIDRSKLRDVLGTEPEDFESLSELTPPQRAFLRALANTGETREQGADRIRDLAESLYGLVMPRKSFAGQILKPLEEAGWIVVTKTTEGRGAKTSLIVPTAKVGTEIIEPLLKQLARQVDSKLLDLLKRPLAEILSEMDSDNTYVSGLALEALAFKLMQLLGMTYVGTRVRAERTGGAEVDLIFESARLVFSRWQIQCKNFKKSGASVRVDDVAKEVGLTHTLKSNAIVVVTTGTIGGEARKYANQVVRDSNLAIVLLDGKDLECINDEPACIVDVFRREAEHAMKLKKLSADEVLHD